MSSHTDSRARPRRLVAPALTVLLLAALIALGITKVDITEVGRELAHVGGGWVAAGVVLMVAAFLSRGESWFAAIRAALPDQPVGRGVVTKALLIGMAGSTVAPGRLGEAARAWLVARRYGGNRRSLGIVIGTLISQTILNILALMILALVALAGSAIPGAHVGAIALAGGLPVAGVVALWFGPRALGRLAASRVRGAAVWAARIRHLLAELRRGLTVFFQLRPAVHSVSYQLMAWALQLGCCYAVILAFGLQDKASVAGAAGVLVAVNVTAVLPLTPSNIGVFQAACIAILAPFGVSAAQGLAYGLVLQAIEIVSALTLGLPAMLHEGFRLGGLRHDGSRRLAAD